MKRALIRNITKIHGIFLIIDMLLGIMAEDRVNMRYLDTVVGTEVVDSQVAEWRRAHGFAPPPGDGQAPPVTVQSEETAAEPTMPPEVADTEPEPIAPPEPPSEEVVDEMTLNWMSVDASITPRSVRYIKIGQTGTPGWGAHWLISEITVGVAHP